jgi:hypothetical protein
MSWRDFLASLVDSLAWPASIAFIAWLLRSQLAALLDAPVRRWKAGPVEVEYWEQAAQEVVQNVLPGIDPVLADDDEEIQRLLSLADEHPDAAVVESFKLVEREVRSLARRAGIDGAERLPAPRLADQVVEHGLMAASAARAVSAMAVMRNLAAHASNVARRTSTKDAREYVVLTQATLFALRSPPADRT